MKEEHVLWYVIAVSGALNVLLLGDPRLQGIKGKVIAFIYVILLRKLMMLLLTITVMAVLQSIYFVLGMLCLQMAISGLPFLGQMPPRARYALLGMAFFLFCLDAPTPMKIPLLKLNVIGEQLQILLKRYVFDTSFESVFTVPSEIHPLKWVLLGVVGFSVVYKMATHRPGEAFAPLYTTWFPVQLDTPAKSD